MIESEFRILLQNISIQTRKNYAHELRELGLHIGQELALFHLWEQDGIPQAKLRNKIGSVASTMSNMLRKLEQDDIVIRKPDEVDHCISNVYLTEKGR
ncbi:MarR family winged helix-turn-helix transcriptional regulator [Sporosarcina sp. D27]|uniref:MarR family winged helix-turn-helix transcriptional regulator n=1 Tax=Sporosarcina sp. D27 TaxID=1382305 RepID=UPI0004AF5B12|nr:MarR family transcriptional regulator [Sporosarcina sp. D27]